MRQSFAWELRYICVVPDRFGSINAATELGIANVVTSTPTKPKSFDRSMAGAPVWAGDENDHVQRGRDADGIRFVGTVMNG